MRGKPSGAGEMPNKELVTKRFLKVLEAFQKMVAQEMVIGSNAGPSATAHDPAAGHLAGISGLKKKGGHALR